MPTNHCNHFVFIFFLQFFSLCLGTSESTMKSGNQKCLNISLK